ncbi:helix-turn-helix domain-containing protein [Streptomyces achromogenes]|uniref:PucR family transcriptional regulator n=1 Tax=Streptomyces achromogenes TaxID=67255 RepID=UPI0036B0F14E
MRRSVLASAGGAFGVHGVRRSRRTPAACLPGRRRAEHQGTVEGLARQAEWPPPDTVACLLVRQGAGGGRASGLGRERGAGVLEVTHGADLVLIVPEPEAAGTVEWPRTAVRGRAAALGPSVPPRGAWVSLHCARLMPAAHALPAHREAPAGADAFVRAGDGSAEAHLRHGIHIGRLLGDRVLGVLRDLPPGRAARLAETLDALLMSWNRTAPEVARVLDIHPQTARKRLRRLEELFGERLSGPAFRFEALLALRTRALTPAPGTRPASAG